MKKIYILIIFSWVNYINAQKPVADFYSSNDYPCAGDSVDFTDFSTYAPTSWQWDFPGGIPSYSYDRNPQNICFPNYSNPAVTLVVSNQYGSDAITNYLFVNEVPVTPTFSCSGDTICASTDLWDASYQWLFNGDSISGSTSNCVIADQPGNYSITTTNVIGCIKNTLSTCGPLRVQDVLISERIFLFPNPATNQLTIKSESLKIQTAEIYNTLGKQCHQSEIPNLPAGQAGPKSEITLDVSSLSPGLYFLQLKTEKGMMVKKFVKE